MAMYVCIHMEVRVHPSCLLFLFFKVYLYLFYEYKCLYKCVYVFHVHTEHMKARRGFGSPDIRVTDSREHPCKHWEPKLCPLKEQQILLTTKSSV